MAKNIHISIRAKLKVGFLFYINIGNFEAFLGQKLSSNHFL